MFEIPLNSTALVVCRGISCFFTLGSVNPAQRLHFPVAVPQCALRTTSVAPGTEAGYRSLCGMPVEEAPDAAQGTVPLPKNQVKAKLPALSCWLLVTPGC